MKEDYSLGPGRSVNHLRRPRLFSAPQLKRYKGTASSHQRPEGEGQEGSTEEERSTESSIDGKLKQLFLKFT